jgi:multiple sugar transport system substrate-binding protein
MNRTSNLKRITASTVAVLLVGGLVATTPAKAADPITLTMWTRSVTAVQSQDMVNAYNLANKDKVEIKLTVVPFAEYLAKVSAAAAANNLPDILAANVIDGPNYTRSGLWLNIDSRIKKLPYFKELAPGHMASALYNRKYYAVPHVVDASSIYYNKVLFEKAGLDPNKPPTSLNEMAIMAAKISELGNGVDGIYFPGNCGGCLAFTLFPSIWAQGQNVLNPNGKGSYLGSAKAKAVFNVYNKMFKAGTMAAASKNEAGATQNAVFQSGKAGFALLGSKALGTIKESDVLKIGLVALSGPDGGTSTFVGGDTIGITTTSKNANAAWDFLKWTLEDKQQIDLYASKNFMTSRRDLADNKFAIADPRMVLLNKLLSNGQSPYATRFFQTFNDANGPWILFVREAIFGNGVSPQLLAKLNASLAG